VLKSIALLPNYFSAPFHPYFLPALTFPYHSPQTCHDTIPPSYTLSTCWPTYYTNFTQTQTLQSLTQSPYTTTEMHTNTHTRATKPSSPCTASPTHPPHFPPPLLVPL
jgi:hypothetical protein